jgi:putative DNA primase/helicase
VDSEQDRFINQRAGFVRDAEGVKEFCIFTEVFRREVCDGYDALLVARALEERGFLVRGSDGKLQAVRRPPGGKALRVYVVRETILQV